MTRSQMLVLQPLKQPGRFWSSHSVWHVFRKSFQNMILNLLLNVRNARTCRFSFSAYPV